MKRILTTLLFVYASVSHAQETTPQKDIWFGNDFQIALGVNNILPNNSMMGDAHKLGFPKISMRIGIFHAHQWTLGITGSLNQSKVKDPQFFGDFDETIYREIGPYVSYYKSITENDALEAYASYDYVHYTATGNDKKMTFESNGLGLALDWHNKISNRAYMTIGFKYSINKLNTKTHPNWEKYLNNYNYASVKVGFTFAKYRK